MTGLGAAVVAYNQTGLLLSDKIIGQQALACISEPEVYNNIGMQGINLSCTKHNIGKRGQ